MDSFVAAWEAARQKARVADHILTQTYPLLKDPKLLVAVLQNLVEAVDKGLHALLAYEHAMKRFPPPGETFESRLTAFRHHLAPRYGVPRELLRFISELQETVKEHRESPVEFVRKSKFVICDNNYRLRTLTEQGMKEYVRKTKEFLELMGGRLARNDAVIARRD